MFFIVLSDFWSMILLSLLLFVAWMIWQHNSSSMFENSQYWVAILSLVANCSVFSPSSCFIERNSILSKILFLLGSKSFVSLSLALSYFVIIDSGTAVDLTFSYIS